MLNCGSFLEIAALIKQTCQDEVSSAMCSITKNRTQIGIFTDFFYRDTQSLIEFKYFNIKVLRSTTRAAQLLVQLSNILTLS